MATFNCTATIAQPAFPGESVPIVLSGAESLSIIPLLVLGQSCVSSSSSATGTVDFIDTKGHSFRVKPKMPTGRFNSGTTNGNTLNALELITVTL